MGTNLSVPTIDSNIMSFANDSRLPADSTDAALIGNADTNGAQPKSRKKFWLLGGCGCLTFVGLLMAVAVGVIVYQMGIKPLNDFTKQNLTMAKDSPKVQERIGTPITLGQPVHTPGAEPQTFSTRTPISGPDGNGTIVIESKMEPGANGMPGWNRTSMRLEIGDEAIELNPDAEQMPDLDIDLGL